MEAGGGLDVGHIFARLDAKLDDSNFRRFDSAVDRSRAKTRGLAGDQDRLRHSTDGLTNSQKRQAQALREQGEGWGSVARKLGVSGSALKGYRNEISQADEALKSHNTTVRTTVREQERVRKSTRDSERSFTGLEGAIGRTNRVASFFSRTIRLLKWPALIAAVGAALQGISALAAGVVGLTSALAPLSGLLVALPAAFGTLGQSIGVAALALMGIKEAVKSLNAAQLKSGETAEDSAKRQRSAAREIRSAQEQVRSAEEQLGDAQRTEKGAQHELNIARREAVQTLQDMRNAAINARIDERGAQLALRRAIADLWKAESDPKSSMLDIEELELRVRESRQQLKEAREDNKSAQAENRKAQKGGVRKDPTVVAAERSKAEAKHDVAKAEREVTKAEEDAKEARVEANASLHETSAAARKVRESFAELTPEAAKFARFLFGLKPELQGLQKVAAKGFLPGAESGIKAAMQNLPVVKTVIGATSRVLGNLSERAGKLFGSRGFGRDLEVVGKGNARTLGLMGRSAEHLTKALTTVMVVAQPLLRFLGKYVNHLSAWIEKSAEVNKKNGDMAKFFGQTRQVVEVLTSIFQSLGATLHVIGEESAPLGREILKAFDDGAQGLERWSESTKGRNSIGQYFKDARGPLWEAGRLVKDIVDSFFQLGDGEGMESIEHLLHQLRVELLPVFTEMTKETTASFGPHLIEMLTQVLGLFGRLSGASGPLTLYVDTLTAAAKMTNFLLDSVPGLNGLVVNFLGLAAVLKTIHGIGKFTGITKGLEWAFGEDFGTRLKGRITTSIKGALKSAFARGAAGLNVVTTWGSEIAGQAAAGISKQIGRFKAVARRAAIAFIGVFAPEVAAGMAAGGRLGEVLSEKFPRVAGMFKRGGKMAGKGFLVGVLLGAALLGVELGNAINKQWPELGPSMRRFGIRAGEWLVNGLIDAVNLGIKGINVALDKANVLGKLGVNAPNIGEVGHVDWHSKGEKRKRAAEHGVRGGVETEPGVKTIPGQTAKEQREEIREYKENRRAEEARRKRRRRRRPSGATASTSSAEGWADEDLLEPRLGTDDHVTRRPGRKKAEDEAKDTRKKVTDQHRKLRQDVEGETDRLQHSVLDRFGDIRKGGTSESKRLDKAVTGAVQDMRDAHDKNTAAMLSATDTRFEGMRTIVSQRSSKMREDLSGNVDEMNETTSAGMDQIQASVVKALKAFGVKNVDLNLTPGDKGKGKPRKAAEGGVFSVPGEGLQDTVYLPGVHAMVAPGEDLFVANRHQQPLLDLAVANTFGTPDLDSFFATFNRPHYLARGGRAGGRSYAEGGMVEVPSDPDRGTDPNDSVAASIVGAVNSWIKRYHADITAAYDPGGGHLSPGHNVTGTATDVVPAGGWTPSGTSLFEQGLHYLVTKGFEVLYDGRAGTVPFPNHGRGNHAHIEWVGNGTVPDAIAHLGGMGGLQRIKNLVVNGPDGTVKTLVQAALDRTTKGANKYLERRTGSARRGLEAGLDVPLGPIKKMAREMVTRTWGQNEWGAFNSLEMSEAGWDPHATNPESGAYGLPQALPASKLPPGAGPGSRLPVLQQARLQLQWMIDYVKERYGSPSAAWSFHQANNWYARGGRVLRHFAKGGSFKGNINHRYAPHWAPDYGGETLPSYVVAALAEAAGAPGRTMEQVTRGESGGHRKNTARPGSAGVDAGGTKGYGLWAITSPFANSIVRKYGGYGEMWNPVKNAAAMKEVLGQNGLGAWYGTGSVTGSNLHYQGKYDIRNALGGMSFKEALAGRRTPGRESVQAERRGDRAAAGKKGKRPRPGRAGLDTASFASAPRGKYSPAALMRTVAETGIAPPYALMKNGVPNWKGLSSQRYTALIKGYYEKVAEYRKTLGEERQQVEERFREQNDQGTPKPNPLLGTVTTLDQSTISSALGFNPPLAGDVSAYSTGYAALGAFDQRAEDVRTAFIAAREKVQGSYINTFTEKYLRPYKEIESGVEYKHTAALAAIDPEAEKKAFNEAKLKGLHKRLKRTQEGRKHGPKAQTAVANAEVVKGRRRKPKRAGRRFARGGRLANFARGGRVLTYLAKGGKGGKAKTAVGPGRNAANPTSPKGIRKKTQAQIKRHNRVVAERARRRRERADTSHEEESEGIFDPVEREREEIEEREEREREEREEREAYETARREELVPLLNEVALNTKRTSIIGASQSSLFSSAKFFARGGAVTTSQLPHPPAPAGGDSHVSVPLAIHLKDSALSALNPHIEAIVDGKLHDLGRAAGGARTTVSAPGRRVSYGGK